MSGFYNGGDIKHTEIAILMTTCNKYNPGVQTFYLQSMVPMKDKTNSITITPNISSNIQNKDSSDIGLSEVKTTSTIQLEVPRDVTRNYPKKWIPPGTRFIVGFTGGDITKPKIVGRDF